MKELVIMKNKQAVTTSLRVAESFGKKHQHVMEAIRKLTVENSTVGNMFVKSTYFNQQNLSCWISKISTYVPQFILSGKLLVFSNPIFSAKLFKSLFFNVI